MFREMRRSKQVLPEEVSINILNKATAGVLAVSGDDDYPYAVPLSYVYKDDKIYFHCAKTGHKLDGIMKNEKVSFCVIEKDDVIPEKYTTHFRSVIVFGKARILESEEDKRTALEILAEKYSPNHKKEAVTEIEKSLAHTAIVEITIDHMSGKEAIELTKMR